MNLNFGFIIISPDNNIGGLKNTIRSIKNNYDDSSIICCVNKQIKNPQLKEMKTICPTFKGGNTITSLINEGYERLDCKWGILLIEGSRICKNLKERYSKWIKSDKDILYPLVVDYDINWYPKKIYDSFYNCTLNGICINKLFFKEVGKLSDMDLEKSRKMWTIKSSEKGANFKSILGIKIC